ncbi:Ribosomal RNA small subunit methyltransferase H [Chlorella vulgaris]
MSTRDTGRLSGPRHGSGTWEGLGPVIIVLVAVHIAALLFWIVSLHDFKAQGRHQAALIARSATTHRRSSMSPTASARPLRLLHACACRKAVAAAGLPGARHARPSAAAATTAATTAALRQLHQRPRRVSSSASAAAEPAVAPSASSSAAAAVEEPHISVLLTEVLAAFEGCSVRRYVDGTLGAAGHATAMLRKHPEMESLVGFDLDPTAHQLAAARLAAAGATVVPVAVSAVGARASFEAPVDSSSSSSSSSRIEGRGPTAFIVRSNFGRMQAVLQQLPLGSGTADGSSSNDTSGSGGGVDAILLDLGVSSMQVDTADRGFSFMKDGPLDMRMDPGAPLSAEGAVNSWSEAELGRVIKEYGEERHWRAIARRIVEARESQAITTTQQLVRAIGSIGGGGAGARKSGRRGAGGGDAKYKHPATRTFQALRIAVNAELQSVAQALPDAIDCLAPGGRLAVITFHSLEDRIVKWAFRRAAGMAPSDEQLPSYCLPFEEASVRILTRRPVTPSEDEQRANVRCRSAKLRVVQKL